MMPRLSVGVKTQMQQSELEFQHVINKLMKQDIDGPVALSLLEYTGNVMDIELVLNMTDSEIDNLYYFKEVADTSPPDVRILDILLVKIMCFVLPSKNDYDFPGHICQAIFA